MLNEKRQFSLGEVEDFIWFHLCKSYNKGDEGGVNFAPLLDKANEETPGMQEISRSVNDLEEQGHIVKRIKGKEFWVELTPIGKKNCESMDIASSWCV